MLNDDHQDFLGKYFKAGEHYTFDEAPKPFIKSSNDVTSEVLDKALSHSSHQVLMLAINHPNISTHHIDKALSDFSDYDSDILRRHAIKRTDVTREHLDKALNDPSWYVRKEAAKHQKLTKEQLLTALKDHDSKVYAISNPNYKKYFPNGHE